MLGIIFTRITVNSMKFDLKEEYGFLQPNGAFNFAGDQEGI